MDQQPQNQPEQSPPEPEAPNPPSPGITASKAPESPVVEQESTTEPVAKPAVVDSPAASESRPNQLAALMLTSSFGFYGVHQLYLGNKTQGFVRLGLAVLSLPLMIVLVGFLIVPVLGLWALYDFVRIGFGQAKDAQGHELAGSDRDKQWAKILTIVALVLFGLYLVFVILLFSAGAFSALNDGLNSSTTTSPTYDFQSY